MTTVPESVTSYLVEAGVGPSPIPTARPHRLYSTLAMCALVRETHVDPARFIWPVFVCDNIDEPCEITAMPGQYQHTIDPLHRVAAEAVEADAGTIGLFGAPVRRDAVGSQAWAEDGILNHDLAIVCVEVGDVFAVYTDTCPGEFTDHGHCGLLDSEGGVDNDVTLPLYQAMAISQMRTGTRMVSPSSMMDGQVAAIRVTLDRTGHMDAAILAYSVGYASAYFGPFREAIGSTLKGDRHTYQQDLVNRCEGLFEALLSAAEGADMLMIKSTGPCLDALAGVAAAFGIPVAVYQVSGEHVMVEAIVASGWIGRTRIIGESLTDIFRAGADSVLTYQALGVARRIR